MAPTTTAALIATGLIAAAAITTSSTAAADAAPAATRTTAQGVYTEKQAAQGLAVHEKYCAKCHHRSFYQGSFMLSWQNQPVSALFDLIKLKMPEDRPGALKPREYASLLAYMFELNKLPAGEQRLGHEHSEMEKILIARD